MNGILRSKLTISILLFPNRKLFTKQMALYISLFLLDEQLNHEER